MAKGENSLIIATKNQGKIQEISELLHNIPFSLLSLTDIQPSIALPEETGTTYEENALIKAKAVAEQTGILTIADDSGMEVDALPGQWGVRSARQFSGSNEERNQYILEQLKDQENRKAKYVCVAVVYDPKKHSYKSFTGELFGEIAQQVQGEGGFGFDPIFIPFGYQETFGKLGTMIKNTISHRAHAFQAVATYLEQLGKE